MQQSNNEEELLTIEELANVLKVHKFWIYNRTRKGQDQIPHLRFGKHLRFERKKVMEFFKNQNANQNQEANT